MKKLFILFVLLLGSWSFAMDGTDYFNKGFMANLHNDYAKAAKLYRKACDMGNADGCYNLGVFYRDGQQGVKQSYVKAAELFRKSCDLGRDDGCNNLGVLYVKGKGVRKDYIKAAELFKKACNSGLKMGCKNYNILYAIINR